MNVLGCLAFLEEKKHRLLFIGQWGFSLLFVFISRSVPNANTDDTFNVLGVSLSDPQFSLGQVCLSVLLLFYVLLGLCLN